MTKHPYTVFVYGTLKRGHGNNRLLKDGAATFMGEAVTVQPYILTSSGVPFMAKVRKPPAGAPVLGEVWTCDLPTRGNLDILEGHPRFYRREPIDVKLLGPDGRPSDKAMVAEAYLIQGTIHGRPVHPDARGWLEWERRVARKATS